MSKNVFGSKKFSWRTIIFRLLASSLFTAGLFIFTPIVVDIAHASDSPSTWSFMQTNTSGHTRIYKWSNIKTYVHRSPCSTPTPRPTPCQPTPIYTPTPTPCPTPHPTPTPRPTPTPCPPIPTAPSIPHPFPTPPIFPTPPTFSTSYPFPAIVHW